MIIQSLHVNPRAVEIDADVVCPWKEQTTSNSTQWDILFIVKLAILLRFSSFVEGSNSSSSISLNPTCSL
jgi:hypothetical protein